LAAAEQVHEFAGGGLLQFGVELLGPARVHLCVRLGRAVGQCPAGGVLELQARAISESGSRPVSCDMVLRNMCERT
jgi:hypothetical protein